ncbi:hypothetical protein JHK87_004218 [Glycine soja]|nr:hypothetical protein JHK87_004218 [Glycine soja]
MDTFALDDTGVKGGWSLFTKRQVVGGRGSKIPLAIYTLGVVAKYLDASALGFVQGILLCYAIFIIQSFAALGFVQGILLCYAIFIIQSFERFTKEHYMKCMEERFKELVASKGLHAVQTKAKDMDW